MSSQDKKIAKKLEKELEQRFKNAKIKTPGTGSDAAEGNKLRRDLKRQTGADMKPSAARKFVQQIRKDGK